MLDPARPGVAISLQKQREPLQAHDAKARGCLAFAGSPCAGAGFGRVNQRILATIPAATYSRLER
jgi:hypothetical protein